MRPLSADLLAAQSAPDSEALVTIRCKRRATFAGDPLAWRPLFQHTAGNLPYGDAGVTAAACSCNESGAMIRVLRSNVALKLGAQRFNALTWSGDGSAWPAAAVTALTTAPTQIATLAGASAGESTPGIGRIADEIRVLYADGATVYRVRSATDGATWGSAAIVWNLSATYTRLTNFSLCAAPAAGGGGWIAVFNGVTAGGAWRVRGMHGNGITWTTWATEMPADGADWQVLGVRAGSPYEPNPCVYVYLTGTKSGWSTLACQRVALTVAGAFSAWDGVPKVVDRSGPTGGVAFARGRFADAGGSYLFALQERAVKGYWFVSALFGLPGSLDMEEPVYLGDADVGAASAEHLTPVQCGRRAWLVGAGSVYASAQADEPANLTVRSYTPTAYGYTAAANGGGVLALTLDRSQSGEGAPEKFGTIQQPEVYVGDILWLDRTLSTGSQSGKMTLAFRVVQVAYRRGGVDVLAADALGVLAHMRPRRPKVLAAGERPRMADVDALCHWCGLDVSGAGTLPQAGWASPGFIWAANESGLGALRRYLMDQVTALRSAGADTETAHTAVQLLPLPVTSSYTYVSPQGLAAGLGVHEIGDWQMILDSRQARLLAANGLATANDPLGEEGVKAWSIATARALPGSRPYPLALVDYSFAASDGRLQELAVAQAQWLLFGLPIGWIEATANLGVELYDVITVDQTKARVVGITETFERGRLRQRLELAEVDGFGVSVG